MSATTQEPDYDVFISYRRGVSDELALLLQTKLHQRGLSVFVDRDLRRGRFDNTLLCRIAETPSFLVILTPSSLDRCSEEEDWLRKEIVQAIGSQRNIIPLQIDSFQFTPDVVRNLDPTVRDLSKYQVVEYSRTYFESTIDRIVRIVEEDKIERKVGEEVDQRRFASKRNKEKKEPGKAEREQQACEREQIESRKLAEQERLSRENEERKQLSIETKEREERELDAPKDESVAKIPKSHHLRKSLWTTIITIAVAILISGSGWLFSSLKLSGSKGLPKPQPSPERTFPAQRTARPDAAVVQPTSAQNSGSQPVKPAGAQKQPPRKKPLVSPSPKNEVNASTDDERGSRIRKALDLANNQRDRGHYRDAINTYNEILKLDSNNPEAKAGLAKAQQAAEWEVSN